MAGDWIKLRDDIHRNPRVLRMAAIVGQNRWEIVGRVSDIWAWIGGHTSDGDGVMLSDSDIDAMVETPGFASAMRAVGWLTGKDGSPSFPEWDKHNSSCAKARALESEAKKLRRGDAKVSDNMSDKCPTKRGRNVGPEKRRVRGREEGSLRSPPPNPLAGGEQGEADAPKGAPLTEAEAIARCQTIGCPDWYVMQIFNELEGTGWVDRCGRRVRGDRFAHHVKACYIRREDMQTQIDRRNGTAPKRAPLSDADQDRIARDIAEEQEAYRRQA